MTFRKALAAGSGPQARKSGRLRLLLVLGVAAVSIAAVVGVVPRPARADTSVTLHQHVHVTLEMSECGVMYVGTRGTCIQSLQTWMNYIDDSHLDVDGVYGQATLAAVEQWQRTNIVRQYHKTADGHFGAYSRLALREWYLRASDNGKHDPCQPRTGYGCDPGAAEPGVHGGVKQILACTVVGTLTIEAGAVACEVYLD
jgi:hypothetical protein